MNVSQKLANQVSNYNNPYSVGSKLRAVWLLTLISIIHKIHEKYGKVSILDIGGRKSYWNILPQELLKEYKIHSHFAPEWMVEPNDPIAAVEVIVRVAHDSNTPKLIAKGISWVVDVCNVKIYARKLMQLS